MRRLAYADEDHVEAVAQDLGQMTAIEGLTMSSTPGQATLLLDRDRCGERADGSQYVGLQDYRGGGAEGGGPVRTRTDLRAQSYGRKSAPLMKTWTVLSGRARSC